MYMYASRYLAINVPSIPQKVSELGFYSLSADVIKVAAVYIYTEQATKYGAPVSRKVLGKGTPLRDVFSAKMRAEWAT
jgi:hypothetical protein